MHSESGEPCPDFVQMSRELEMDRSENWDLNERKSYGVPPRLSDHSNQAQQFIPEHIGRPGFFPIHPWFYPPFDEQGMFSMRFHPLNPYYANCYTIPYGFCVPEREPFKTPQVPPTSDSRDPSLKNLHMLNQAIKHLEEAPHIHQNANQPHQQHTPNEATKHIPAQEKATKKRVTHRSSRFCEVESCETTRHFGPPGGKTRFCFYHKEEGMVNLSLRRCLECTKTASFGYINTNRKEYCYEHRKPDTINLSLKRCGHEGCERPASSSYCRKLCSLHKDDALSPSYAQDLGYDSDTQSSNGFLEKKVKVRALEIIITQFFRSTLLSE